MDHPLIELRKVRAAWDDYPNVVKWQQLAAILEQIPTLEELDSLLAQESIQPTTNEGSER